MHLSVVSVGAFYMWLIEECIIFKLFCFLIFNISATLLYFQGDLSTQNPTVITAGYKFIW